MSMNAYLLSCACFNCHKSFKRKLKHHDFHSIKLLADAILDRLVHSAYRIEMKGESMRKTKSKLTHDVKES